MAKDKFKEQKDYNELISVNSLTQINKIKEEINKYLPNDIKIIAKNESQKKLINSIKNNEITIVAGPAGCGKAQPLNSLILCENGYKKMGNINIGDNVYSMSGKLTKVVNIFPQGIKDIYKITFSDNSEVECCNEHLWLIKSSKDRNNNKDYSIKQLSDLKNDFLIRNNRKNYSIPITNPIDFKNIDVTIHPYLMGILIGDGCFTSPNVKITNIDNEIINSFNVLLDNNYSLSQVSSDSISYNIVFKNKKDSKNRINNELIPFTKLILNYNLLNKKSNNKFIPNDYKFNSIQNRIELLQGLMDSDGTIDKNGKSFSFSTTSEQLIEDFRFLIESLGGVVNKLRIKKNKYKKNDKYIICNNSYSYSFRLPSNIIPFKLERKKNKIKEKTKYFPIRYIKNIEYIGKKEAQCIMVEDKNHTYLTNNFVVTHNTFVALGYALSLLRKNTNRFKKIYLVKSVTTLKGEEIGFLKGDWKEKIEPFMWSFYINMEKLLIDSAMKLLIEKDIIRPFPLAYLRGASLDDCIIIADEMQNVSLDNSRTLLTRIGSNCKLILLGDINQIDMKNKNESSLETLLDMFKDTENFGVIKMNIEDTNVRNPIISVIEDKFNDYNLSNNKNGNGNNKNNKILLVENTNGE